MGTYQNCCGVYRPNTQRIVLLERAKSAAKSYRSKKGTFVKIRRIVLRNFKRFTDATIGDIPAEARLVLIVGPNGCGKSSVLDAVNMWFRMSFAGVGGWDETYHRKQVPDAR